VDQSGWAAAVEWFGYSPNFHDAEVISIDLRRDPEPSTVRVHAWRTNTGTHEAGQFQQDQHALVTFTMHSIQTLRLDGWNAQNVLWELSVEQATTGFTLHLPQTYGLDGEITASEMLVAIEAFDPG